MTTRTKPGSAGLENVSTAAPRGPTRDTAAAPIARLTSDEVWRALARASFAVVSHVTPGGEPRSSGVVYATAGQRLYLAVAPESWKARQIATGSQVAVTVPLRRGGPLALILPIPPATISFHATAIVHPAGSIKVDELPKALLSLLPDERRDTACVIELIPRGQFLTFGVGVSLMDMRNPVIALARVPVSAH